MPLVSTFCEFFGCSGGGGGSETIVDYGDYTADGAIESALHLQLEHHGRDITYVNPDGSLATFRAIVHKEKLVKAQPEYGVEEMITREIAFPANSTTGRATIQQFSEVRIGTAKYQIFQSESSKEFWHVTLRRVVVNEISRGNRRGRM